VTNVRIGVRTCRSHHREARARCQLAARGASEDAALRELPPATLRRGAVLAIVRDVFASFADAIPRGAAECAAPAKELLDGDAGVSASPARPE
jgi:hypothetical protein